MQVAVVTGTSKGLGYSITKFLLEQNIHVIGISRTENKALTTIANEHAVSYEHLTYDLGNMVELTKSLHKINESIEKRDVDKLFLVNNAAVLQPINHSREIALEDLAFHIQVNTTAPMGLMNECLRISDRHKLSFYGVNITSGAANRPVYGWSAYCSTKACINRYTETIALEQESLKTNYKVFAFSPGVMDTNMQELIRSSDESAFKDVKRFRQYKEEASLKTPDDVGQIVVDILTDESTIKNGKIYDVADYL